MTAHWLAQLSTLGALVSGLMLAVFLETEQRAKVSVFPSSVCRASYLLMAVCVFALWVLTGLFCEQLPATIGYLLTATGTLGVFSQSKSLLELIEKVVNRE